MDLPQISGRSVVDAIRLTDRLPRLERIAEPNWQDGQVVSLAAPAEPVRITDSWTLCAPGALDVGLDPL